MNIIHSLKKTPGKIAISKSYQFQMLNAQEKQVKKCAINMKHITIMVFHISLYCLKNKTMAHLY